MNEQKERILVTVKTYPTLSKKYGETVCTAGVREDGTWVRIYPVPFRRLEAQEQYKKYDWIECRLIRNKKDQRPESFRPYDQSDLQAVGHIATSHKWRERRRILLDNAKVYERRDEIVAAAKANQMSLCVFKPTEMIDLVCEEDEREWDPAKLAGIRNVHSQSDMFEDNDWRTTFEIIPKLPYNFSYRFEDSAGKTSELQILDWEIGALYWNCLRLSDGNESMALEKVRQKYIDQFLNTDLHLFLGTTQRFHSVAPNPWVIVGVFPVPRDDQLPLL